MADTEDFISALQVPSSLLPIAHHKTSLLYTIEKFPVTILVGQTGSGKTTQLPQYLLQGGWANDGKIITVTQPRRVAATAVAKRVAAEVGCQLGQQVGYSIRFEDVTSDATRIKFVTDGLLLREALVDPLLSRYSVIMVDEAHERSLSTDILLGLLVKIWKQRPELRIIVSSATIQVEPFARFFENGASGFVDQNGRDPDSKVVKVISVEGRAYPVDIHYLASPCEDYLRIAVDTIFSVHSNEGDGDILLFLNGREEIEKAIGMIAERIPSIPQDQVALLALPMYAGLNSEQQMFVFEPAANLSRKVICATNIAEASVTIEGIVFVIDTGFVKLRAFNPITGIESLVSTAISKASAVQRAGRAGRTQPGKCFRLYTEEAFECLDEATVPEIQRSDLTSTILQLKALGIDNIARFNFITPPPAEIIIRALEQLFALGGLDVHARLTKPLGTRMAEIGVEPMLSKCLLSSASFGCQKEVLSIAAMITLQGGVWFSHDARRSEETARRKFAVEEGDLLTLLNVYEAFVGKGKQDMKWCQQHFLNFKSMCRAVKIRRQLQRYLERFGIGGDESLTLKNLALRTPQDVDSAMKTENIRRCLTSGFFPHAAKMQADGTFRIIGGDLVLHAHPSSLFLNRKADWVIFGEVVESGEKTYIRDITKIQRGWLLEYAKNYYKLS